MSSYSKKYIFAAAKVFYSSCMHFECMLIQYAEIYVWIQMKIVLRSFGIGIDSHPNAIVSSLARRCECGSVAAFTPMC